jgi:hypothetical protein
MRLENRHQAPAGERLTSRGERCGELRRVMSVVIYDCYTAKLAQPLEAPSNSAERGERRGRRLEVRIEPFARLSTTTRRAIAEEADRLGEFLDAPAELEVAA